MPFSLKVNHYNQIRSTVTATLVTLEAAPVRTKVSVVPEQALQWRIRAEMDKLTGSPAAAAVADAVAPGTATPSLYSVTMTVPAAVGEAVTETSTS